MSAISVKSPRTDEKSLVTTSVKAKSSVPTHHLTGSRRSKGGRGRYNPNMPRSRRPTNSRAPNVRNMKVSDAAWLASKAWQGVKLISKLINVEEKLFDVNASGGIANTGAIFNLSNIAQGTDYNNRDGDSLLTQRLDFSMIITNSTALASTGNAFIRLIIFRDNDQLGADPTVANVLQSAVVTSPLTFYTERRFDVLDDRLYAMNNNGASALQYRLSLNLNKHIYFQNTTGADASNFEGALFLLALSDQATNTPTISYYSRLAFTDN
jgi:hypothetical protein